MHQKQDNSSPIALDEKLGFASLTFGHSLISDSLSTFALYYFTDILLLPAAIISIILFAVRLFDGVVDPFIGHYIDRRTTRHGKYKGYLYYWTPVFCLMYIGIFLPIPLSPSAKVIWIFIVYILFSGTYSMAQVARQPLLSAMTNDIPQRHVLNSIKTASGIVATIVVQYFMLKMVVTLGNGSEKMGFAYTAVIFALTSTVCVLIGTARIQERNIPKNNDMHLIDCLKTVIKNKEILFVFFMIFANYIGTSIKSQSAIYYMKYFVNRQDLTPIFLLVGVGSSLLMQPVIVYLAKRISTVKLIFAGSIGGALSMLLIGFANTSLPVLMCGNILFGITTAFPANLISTYTANISDAFSKKHDASFNGIINSTLGLASRLGYSIAGAIIALVLYFASYEPNTVQSEGALMGIQITFVLLTCLSYVAIAVCVLLSHKNIKTSA